MLAAPGANVIGVLLARGVGAAAGAAAAGQAGAKPAAPAEQKAEVQRAKRPAEPPHPAAHLLPASSRKKPAVASQITPIWSNFFKNAKPAAPAEEKQEEEAAPETVESELTRWFAQRPADEW